MLPKTGRTADHYEFELAKRRNQVRERIAAWARDHGVNADAVTEELLP